VDVGVDVSGDCGEDGDDLRGGNELATRRLCIGRGHNGCGIVVCNCQGRK